MSENISIVEAMNSPYATIKSLGDAIEVAVEITDQMVIKHVRSNDEYKVNMPINPDKDNTYRYYAETISFNYNGKKYELPAADHIEKALDDAGFEAKFEEGQVVACNGWYPAEKKEYWEQLQAIERTMDQIKTVSEIQKRRKDCIEHCKVQNIKPLDEELRDRCFKIPDTGYIIVDDQGTERLVRPNVFGAGPTATQFMVGKISEHIPGGGYSRGYTFVDTDGSAYVTESEAVIHSLESNGFKTDSAVKHMGIGWGEKFKDPVIQEKYVSSVMSDEEYEKKKEDEKVARSNYVTEVLRTTRDELGNIQVAYEAATAENERLRAMLEQAGINPDPEDIKPSTLS